MGISHEDRALTSSGVVEVREQLVVDVVREIAFELSGQRAASATTATASLERDIGLGSLDRVELMMRLENVFQRELNDAFLLLDTAREIAQALERAPRRHRSGAAPIALPAPPPPATVQLEELTTLVDALERRAGAEAARVHVYLRAATMTPMTYAALWHGARQIAAGLAARGVEHGDRVAIMLPTSADYLQTFMGVLAAGGVAVPLYPPQRLDRLQEYLERQSRIVANAEARLLVTIPEAIPVGHVMRGRTTLRHIVTADELRRGTDLPELPAVTPRDIALIQYTSGSTGDPSGVLLSHGNLIANIRAITAGADVRPTDVIVSWLPLYHDMGLIGSWLTALVDGVPLVLMSPLSFLARPEQWLWAIHERRATLSAAPNFAYELCVRKIRDEAIEGLDLSSWRCALNGSEPVNSATIDRFVARFEPYGFRRSAMMPVYGLAENSVAVAFPPIDREPVVDRIAREPFVRDHRALPAEDGEPNPLAFVSVGRALPEHEVRIVDERLVEVPERTEGRLHFRGPSSMAGYQRNEAKTTRTILADGWVDSGDLAYFADGELYITGRAKDLIIKGGRNVVPQEVEEVAGSVDGILKGSVAAFGVPDETTGTERLVILAESRARTADQRDALEQEVIARVAEAIGLPPDVVRVVPPGVVPKTPSGKIRRAAARDSYVRGEISGRKELPLRLRASLLAGVVATRLRSAVSAAGRGLQIAYLVTAWTLTLVVLGVPVFILMHVLPEGRPVRRLARFISRVLLAISRCPLEVEGRERLSVRGPLVLVSNHASYVDTPVLIAALPMDFVFVAMKELLSWRVVGGLARRSRHLFVDRWNVDRSIADAGTIEDRLRGGETVLFFAEGGFSRASGLRPFRMGAFEAAVASGAPVVPVALRGTRQVLPSGARMPRPRKVSVWIGEPLRSDAAGWKAALELRERAAEAVAEHCGEMRRTG